MERNKSTRSGSSGNQEKLKTKTVTDTYGDDGMTFSPEVSSLQHADLILVLEDGKIIGAGNHSQLMEGCEEYRIIAETQMGEGKEGV